MDHWIKKSVVYHIYVRSFQDTNGDGVGDLPGVIERLDYLNDGTDSSLGVNAIWLSPVYPSPMKDFGYDVADYTNVDPLFGTLTGLEQLIMKSHERGIKVLLDYIPNHTSSLHPWFIQSKRNKENPKRDWYIWRDPKPDGSPPNNWISVFGGSAWELDTTTNQYYFHSFDKDQPDLNWRNPEVQLTMLAVLRFWMDKGVDGFRIDAYEFLFKHISLLDEPKNPAYLQGTDRPYLSLLHTYCLEQPETFEMMKQIAEVLAKYPEPFLVTEVYTSAEKLLEMYAIVQKEWFAPFNFTFITGPWRADSHKRFIDEFDKRVGDKYFPTYVLGNHDQHRVTARIGRDQARNAAILLLTLRGIPFIYYGDEIGMTDGIIPLEKIQDPYEKKSPGLGLGRDPERTPMQWTQNKNAGFSNGEPWLPISTDFGKYNVATEKDDSRSFLSLYKKLIHLRNTTQALTEGTYESISLKNENIFAYIRSASNQRVLIVLNYSPAVQIISLPFRKGNVLIDSQNQSKNTLIDQFDQFNLLPNQGMVVQIVE